MDSNLNNKPYSIGLLLTEGFALMSYASLIEPLRAANLLAENELYKVTDIAVQSSRIKSSSGPSYVTGYSYFGAKTYVSTRHRANYRCASTAATPVEEYSFVCI